jgi:hypothetical protein
MESAVARVLAVKRSEMIACDGGLPPASPMPTPTRAAANCQKFAANPHTAVITDQIATDREMMSLRLPRSAQIAIGTPSVA